MSSIRHAWLHSKPLLTSHLHVRKARPDIEVGKETMVLGEFTPFMVERVTGKHRRGRDEASDGMLIYTLLVVAASWI